MKLEEKVLKGIEMVANGHIGRFSYNPEVQLAIDAGYAYNSDPTWHFSDDFRAGVRAWLTKKGIKIATRHGWLVKCKCKGCDKITNMQFGGFCSTCSGSGTAYGFIEGKCGFHYIGEHPEVYEERRKQKNSKWLPPGTVVVSLHELEI